MQKLLDVQGMPRFSDTDGDSMIWAGLMRAVGYKGGDAGIKNCQSADGRVWRSPTRVNIQKENGFSRDMALGFILYVQATGDYEMADKWVAYLKKEGSLFPREESTDNRHIITPGMWWMMSYAGIKVAWYWRYSRGLAKYWQKIEVRLAPRGYQKHLQAVSALIRSIHDGKRDTATGKYLSQLEPNNPFYKWLSGDVERAQHLNNTFRNMHDMNPGKGTQWCWQREDAEEAWRDSCGWDFLFVDMLCALDTIE